MPTPASPNADATVAGSTWRSALGLVRFAFGIAPREFALTVLTALAGSLTEGAGLVLLLPLLSVAGMDFAGSSTASRLSNGTQQLLVYAGIPHGLWLPVVLGIFLATGALRSVLRRSQNTMLSATATRVLLGLSRRVYGSVVRAQWGFLVRQRSGKLTHLLTQELYRVSDAIGLTLSLINLGCLTLLYLVIALKLSVSMTLLVLAMGGVLMLMQRRSLARMRTGGKDIYESTSEIYAATEEHLLNMKSVKTYNAEDRDAQLFGNLCEDVSRHIIRNAKYQAAADFRFEVGSLAALGVVIFLALAKLHVQPATMLLLLAIFTRLMPQLSSVQSQTHQIAGVLPSYDHVLAIEAECLAHAEPKTLVAGSDDPAEDARLHLENEFSMEDVWFTYEGPADSRDRDSIATEPNFVLRGIDLRIAAGTLTAVVGPSGAGKSTIADLTNGLLPPTRGHILLDGRALDPAEMRQWRNHVGYVGQDTVLFHQTVRENLLWAQPDATDEQLREALLLASAGFVYELPGGLETIVGDRGIMLSSGQRQRISLARALLRKPTLLILDEATNALDVENEANILDAIHDAIRDSKQAGHITLTVLMIAHRASAVRRADRIFELEGGRLERSGTWEELHLSA